MTKPKLWTKDFLMITGINFFLVLTFYFLMVVISAYAMEHFHASPSAAGLASSIFLIGSIVSRLFSGRWVEIVGRRKMLYAGLILFALLNLVYFIVHNILLLFLLRFLHGLAFGIANTAIVTIVSNIIPRERSGEGVGYFALSITLAAAFGPSLGIFLSQYGSPNLIFAAATLFSALAVLNMFFVSVPEITLTAHQIDELKSFKVSNFFEPKALPIALITLILYFSYSGVMTFLSAFSKEVDLVEAAAFFFVVYSITILVSRPFTGRWLDEKGDNLTMYPTMFTYAVGMVLLSQAHQEFTLLLAGAVIGLGLGTIQSSGLAIAIQQTPAHRMGLANSTYFISMDLGVGVGPFILGLFVPYVGYSGIYAGAAVLALGCMFLYHFVHGKNAVRPGRPVSHDKSLSA